MDNLKDDIKSLLNKHYRTGNTERVLFESIFLELINCCDFFFDTEITDNIMELAKTKRECIEEANSKTESYYDFRKLKKKAFHNEAERQLLAATYELEKLGFSWRIIIEHLFATALLTSYNFYGEEQTDINMKKGYSRFKLRIDKEDVDLGKPCGSKLSIAHLGSIKNTNKKVN